MKRASFCTLSISPQGDRGDRGPRGIMGPPGPVGPAGAKVCRSQLVYFPCVGMQMPQLHYKNCHLFYIFCSFFVIIDNEKY